MTYVIRDTDGVYDDVYDSRIERLVACTMLVGDAYVEDNKTVYSLLIEYIGSNREAKPIVDSYKRSQNGRNSWKDLLTHFESSSYCDNLASRAEKAISNCFYTGESLDSPYLIIIRL